MGSEHKPVPAERQWFWSFREGMYWPVKGTEKLYFPIPYPRTGEANDPR